MATQLGSDLLSLAGDINDELNSLTEDNLTLSADLTQAQGLLAQANENHATAQAAANEAERKLAEANARIAELEQRLVDALNLLTEANNAAEASRRAIEDLMKLLADEKAEVARLQAIIDGGAGPVAPPAGYKTLYDFDFTKDDPKLNHRTGTASNNQAIRRKAQTTFTPDGMLVKGELIDGQLYGADVTAEAYPIPALYHGRVKVTFTGLGPGVWPAPGWTRPSGGGEGEQDWLEVFADSHAAGTLHATPYPSKHRGQRFTDEPVRDFSGTHVIEFRVEPTVATWWVDGEVAGTCTKAQFDAMVVGTGKGGWNSQMLGHPWYLRWTMQLNGSQGTKIDTTKPWAGCSMLVHETQVFVPA